jgi:hypothetical protein
MGATFLAPKSEISDGPKQDRIPAFNAQEAESEFVFAGTTADPFPTFPESSPASTAWEPEAPATGTPDAQWKAVVQAWEHPTLGGTAADLAVEAWIGALGWRAVSDFKGDAPEMLLDRFEELILAPPLISVG